MCEMEKHARDKNPMHVFHTEYVRVEVSALHLELF